MSEKYIQTPRSLMPKSLIRLIEPGYAAHVNPDGEFMIVRKNDGKMWSALSPTKEAREWQREQDDFKRLAMEQAAPDNFAWMPTYGSNMNLARWTAGSTTDKRIKFFEFSFTCPHVPVTSGHKNALWGGIDDGNGAHLVQPVLSNTEIDWSWLLANFYVNGSFGGGQTPGIGASGGDALVGIIEENPAGSWSLSWVQNGTVLTNVMTISGLPPLYQALLAFETETATPCSKYFGVANGDCTFRNDGIILGDDTSPSTDWTLGASGVCSSTTTLLTNGNNNPGPAGGNVKFHHTV